MWFKIFINTDNIMRTSISDAKEHLKDFANVVKDKVDENTPEDTKTLLWNTQISQITRIWLKLFIKVYNDTFYAKFVEYWVMWREYKYNKPKWNIFYEWVWVWMFRRAWFALKDKFIYNWK